MHLRICAFEFRYEPNDSYLHTINEYLLGYIYCFAVHVLMGFLSQGTQTEEFHSWECRKNDITMSGFECTYNFPSCRSKTRSFHV